MDKRVSVGPNVLVRELRGEAVLLNLDSEAYFGLDEVGTCMWRALTTTPTVASACEALLAEYDVDPARLREDVDRLLATLKDAGLVDVRDA